MSKKLVEFRKISYKRGGEGPEFLIFLCFFGNHSFVLKTYKNALKLFTLKGGSSPGFLNKIVDFVDIGVLNVLKGEGWGSPI